MTGDGAGVPAGTSRRLLCDAGAAPMLCDQTGKTLDVGRKTRTIPTAIRRALAHRDNGCRFPGCTNTIVDGHHIEHWIDGGKTKLANLVSLCRRHHRFVHEGGAAVENLESGEVRFSRADGTAIVRIPEPIPAAPLAIECCSTSAAIPTDDLRPIDWRLVFGAITG